MKTKHGLLIGAFAFRPAARLCAPGPAKATEFSASDGLIVKAVTAVGVAHRSARRTVRRTAALLIYTDSVNCSGFYGLAARFISAARAAVAERSR